MSQDSTYVDESGEHVIVVHAWQDRYAHYERYLDHANRPVTYISNAAGLTSVPDGAAEIVQVDRTTDPGALRTAAHGLAGRHGRPAAIIALKENHLPTVTRLREEFGTVGPYFAELAPFLDKNLMGELVTGLGIPMPRFNPVSTLDDILAFGAEHGWPVITKPLRGSASEGVTLLAGPADASALTWDRPILAQRYQPGSVYHVDGYWSGDRLGPWRLSRYVGNELDFRNGVPVGAVEIDDPSAVKAMGEYLTALIPGMCADPWVFHLEVFGPDDPGRPEDYLFLEIGRRVGGSETPFLWREVHGLDLMAVECAIQTGNPVPHVEIAAPAQVAGWALHPVPIARPCRVVASNSMLDIPTVYSERVLPPGAVIPDAEAFYEHVGGRFRLKGSSTARVHADVRRVLRDYVVRCTPA